MEATMAYLNRSDQLHILHTATDDAEVINLMKKVHFDDDVLYECAPRHIANSNLKIDNPKNASLREFMLILGVGLFCITLTSHAIDWWMDREKVELRTFNPVYEGRMQ